VTSVSLLTATFLRLFDRVTGRRTVTLCGSNSRCITSEFSHTAIQAKARLGATLCAHMHKLIRKSAYGRTELFLPSKGTLLREVKCMGGISRRGHANVYHVLPTIYNVAGVCCWHCCEVVTHDSIPLPRTYDASEGTYYVYGVTCSPACAKAYILEHTSFDRGHHLSVLTRMLRDVYGVEGVVAETPPRPSLVRFGGMFTPSRQSATSCKVLEPPFVSYCMIIEEHKDESYASEVISGNECLDADVEEEDTFAEPLPTGLYEQFVATHGHKRVLPQHNGDDVASHAKRRNVRPRRGGAAPSSSPSSQSPHPNQASASPPRHESSSSLLLGSCCMDAGAVGSSGEGGSRRARSALSTRSTAAAAAAAAGSTSTAQRRSGPLSKFVQ